MPRSLPPQTDEPAAGPTCEDIAPATLGRHDLVWLAAEAIDALSAETCDPVVRSALQQWLDNDYPLCVRRPAAFEPRTQENIALGIALPPTQDKRRIALIAPRSAIRRARSPLTLSEVIPCAPTHWQTSMWTLEQRASDCGLTLRVFGSAAWQALTHRTYATADSDLDLLVAPSNLGELFDALACLASAESALSLRLDGEIIFPHGDAVAWKEWRQALDPGARAVNARANHAGMPTSHDRDVRVLVKRIDTVTLCAPSALIAQLAAHEDPAPLAIVMHHAST